VYGRLLRDKKKGELLDLQVSEIQRQLQALESSSAEDVEDCMRHLLPHLDKAARGKALHTLVARPMRRIQELV